MKSSNLFPELAFHSLYITGNGFDVHHGLKTKYSDFMSWLVSNTLWDVALLEVFPKEAEKDLLWSSFEKALGKLDLDKIKGNDIQNIRIVEYLDDDGNRVGADPTIADPDIFSRLGLYFSKWANDNNSHLTDIEPDLKFPKDSLFMTFNYTDTLEKVYNIPAARVIHLNGRAASDKSVVIGHDNDIDPASVYDRENHNVREVNNQFQQLTNYANLRKDGRKQVELTTPSYFKEALSDVKEVTVMGHSYEKIDDSYFSTIISYLQDGIFWHLGLHTEEDRNRLNAFVRKFNIANYETFEF